MKRILLIVVVLAGLYFAYGIARDWAVDYYFAHYHTRTTAHPSSDLPDQLVLTWSDDPATSQTINWRTGPGVDFGVVEYRPAEGGDAQRLETLSDALAIEDELLENDSVNHRYSASITGLRPGTEYDYRVGTPDGGWTDWHTFRTGPAASEPFSFIYLGDPQQGLGEWGELIHAAEEGHAEAAFYVIAGDLVNSGEWRNEWDDFFAAGTGIFESNPVVPALGNHDVDDALQAPEYLAIFGLPENGPEGLAAERAYSFEYGNALFVVLDSNLEAADQVDWLEEQLADSTATWKFAVYHHPSYGSRRARDNREVRELWGPLFDKYHVDVAFTGHDHAYLRTHPMKAGARADSPADGTVYVVSVSGTKFYEVEPQEYAVVAFPNRMTYQVIDITTAPDKLAYRAYDQDGEVVDEFVIEK